MGCSLIVTSRIACLLAISGCVVFSGCSSQEPTPSSDRIGQSPESAQSSLQSEPLVAQPLAAVHPRVGPLFELLSPEKTGVDFTNFLRPENNVPYIYIGAGLAAGDYDNDGRTDLYLCSVDGPNRLYRQVADFQFEDVTASSGVDGGNAWSRGATFFDVDNDGDLDIYVCTTEAANLLYVNQGDGTFVESAKQFGLDFVGACVMASAADYDRDGDLDLYVITHRPLFYSVRGQMLERLHVPSDTKKSKAELEFKYEFREENGIKIPRNPDDLFENHSHWEIAGQSDALFRNNGDGTFDNITEEAGLSDHGLGLSCTWLDFDHDGWLDLHVANDLQTKDRLYHNNGDGSFTLATEEVFPHTTWYSMGSDFGDINNDGLFDFLVVDMASTTHYRSKVQMGDMGRFRYFMEAEWPPQLMRNALYLNTGSPRYMEIAQMSGLSASDWTWSVKLQDLDNDGRIDAYFTNGISRADEMDPDLKNEIAQVYADKGETAAVEHIRSQGEDSTRNLAFRNLGDLHFENISKDWGLDFEGISFGAAFADLDQDGDLDLIVNNHNVPTSIYRNNSDQGHRAVFRLRGTRSNRYGVGTKILLTSASGVQVRQLFPVRGYMSCDEPALNFGLGEDKAITSLEVHWPSGHRQTFQNLPADHLFTITEPDTNPPQRQKASKPPTQFEEVANARGLQFTHTEYPYNDFGVQPLLPGKMSQLGPGMAWGDANGDGYDDLFVGGAAGQAGELFLYQEDGTFTKAEAGPWHADSMCEDMAPIWIDVDRDGDLDLVIASGSSEYDQGDPRLANRLYLNDGNGLFQAAEADSIPEGTASSSAIAAADYDGDGDLDLFIGTRLIPGQFPLTPDSALWRNDAGKFVDVTDEVAPELRRAGLVTGALWSDADNDGQLDLLVTTEWGPVKFYRNVGGSLVEETAVAGLEQRTGWWNSIAGGDFDADGDIDYVVFNAGLNTKYGKPSPQKPTLLYYGDMHDTGEMNLIETKTLKDGLLPVRGLSCSCDAMPELREKFSTFNSFASSMLTDIYKPEYLEKATRFEANELASGLLINDGNAKFTWKPLPTLAQISPGYGVVVTDINGDGHVDIYFVQNLFSREPETGAWDGGVSLMLQGDGQGGFESVSPSQSGLVLYGDAKGLAASDLDHDGWPDFAATQNNDAVRLFHNLGVEGRHSLAIRLRGPAGNRDGVGARVTLRSSDTATQTAEIYAGSGYLSQSSPCLFFGRGSAEKDVDLEIRWPDGTVTNHTIAADERSVELNIGTEQ